MQFDSLSLTTRAHAVDLLFRLPAVELSVREKREIHSKTDSIASISLSNRTTKMTQQLEVVQKLTAHKGKVWSASWHPSGDFQFAKFLHLFTFSLSISRQNVRQLWRGQDNQNLGARQERLDHANSPLRRPFTYNS